jgi:hypothetical protein
MASTKIIRQVTQALLKILQANVPSVGSSGVYAAMPDEVASLTPPFLILYLYQVLESPQLRNQGPTTKIVSGPPGAQSVEVRKDPLALDLYYLLIPGAASGPTTFLTTYDILAEAARAFHDNGIFSPGQLGVADLTDEEAKLEFHLSMNPLSTSDLFELWEAVTQPYRLSAAYVVRTVRIDSSDETTGRLVTQRRLDVSET